MGRTKKPLSNTALGNAKPNETEYTLADGSTGLTVRVFPSGRKAFSWRYVDTFREGKMSRIEYGDYPARTLSDARRIHLMAKAARSNGLDLKDPEVLDDLITRATGEQRKVVSGAIYTVSKLVDDYWDAHVEPNIKHKAPYQSRIKGYVLPALKDYPASSVPDHAVKNMLVRIEKEKTLQTRTDVARFASSMWEWGISNFKVKSNPFAHLGIKRRNRVRKQFYSMEELRMLLLNPDGCPLPDNAMLSMKALILSGVRCMELFGAQIREFDFDTGIWTIPAERLKKNKQAVLNQGEGEDFRIPMSRQLQQVMKVCIERFSNKTHVFGAKREYNDRGRWRRNPDTGHMSTRYWRTKVNGYRAHYGITNRNNHDFRRTLETQLGNLGTPDGVTTAVTGHSREGMSRVYNQARQTQVIRTAFQLWADFIDHICAEPPHVAKMFDAQVPGEVLQLIYERYYFQGYLVDKLGEYHLERV
ncbi:tyrosine-type recombinase/integrase [Kistimonas scapharcae]|uniref:Tyrosine-type recombinase/integrase n=1 Tax=Kistimonas scapharcae TaxID=1036133 RepID=A0ABP8V1W0_9GAMM